MNKEDRDFAMRLVSKIKKRPLLYALNHPDNRDRHLVSLAWTSVATEMKSTAEVVKRRWQNLRGSFSKSHSAQNQPSGSGAKRVPKFYLFDQMSFLIPHMTHMPMQGNYSVMQPAQISQEGKLEVQEDDTLNQDEHPASSTPSPTPSICSASSSVSDSAITPHMCRKRHREEASTDWEQALTSFMASRQPKPDCPELDFFKGLVPMVKDLSARKKRKFYAEITSLLVSKLEEQDEAQDASFK